MENQQDELGLPINIDDRPVEVGDKITDNSEIMVNLQQLDAMIDKIRILTRCGATFILKELWHNGVIIISMQTEKGERDVIVYQPDRTGLNAIKLFSSVSEIL